MRRKEESVVIKFCVNEEKDTYSLQYAGNVSFVVTFMTKALSNILSQHINKDSPLEMRNEIADKIRSIIFEGISK